MIFKSLCRNVGIGANSYVLETEGVKVVLDAGMHPEEEGMDAIPQYRQLEEGTVEAIVVTHAHLDHVGTLPVLVEQQGYAKVYLTVETADLGKAMLHNSVNVMMSKRLEQGIVEYPLFDHEDLDRMEEAFEVRGLEKPFYLDGDQKVRATFHDAGHILGSVGVTIEAEGKRVMYTGDVNFEDSSLQKGAAFPEEEVDVLIVETTRGGYERPEGYERRQEEDELASAIRRVIDRGGSVLIPVFAIGKTQEVLTMVQRFKDDGLIPKDTPLHMGGLSTKMTHIYDRHSETSRRKHRGFRFLKDMEIEGSGKRRKGPITLQARSIYALSSGMMSEKTVSNMFARQGILENKKHGLFFVGYCDPSTPGGVIRAAKTGDMVRLDGDGPPVKLQCETRVFDFSGHATRETIAAYIEKVRPKKCLLVHGDEEALPWFEAEVRRRVPGCEIIIPEPGVEIEL